MTEKLESALFKAADKMRGAMDPAEYKHIALGLVFLRYISNAFEVKHAELAADDLADAEDPEEYHAENVFWVPEKARWTHIKANARNPEIGVILDDAMRAIEKENEDLKGVLPKVFANQALDKQMLGGLIDLFTNELKLTGTRHDFDLLGRVYEYFLGGFAGKEGKRGGEFYTPPSVVRTLVAMLKPTKGRMYDPCCGTGGFFSQSEQFIEAHQGRVGDVAVYGQERNHTTWRLAKMNLAIRRIEADIKWNSEGTLLRDALPDLRADFILANPPFNISDWSGELLREDKRWKYGVPPEGNANFAWLQHILHHLSPTGVAGVVLANGSMSSNQSGEGEIRKALVEGDAVDCMVALPGQMFYGTQIPACLWILAKDRSNGYSREQKLRDRRGEVLFIDARKLGFMETRTFRGFNDDEIDRIAQTYHAWRGETAAGQYEDIPGFCKSASIKEIREHGHVLTPGRYVGASDADDDGVPFEERFTELKETLAKQFAEAQRLSGLIQTKLEEITANA